MKETKKATDLLEKQLFVFDMDGTIYLGDRVFEGALCLIRRLRAMGKRILFFTNNASRSKSVYAERLARMGFSDDPGEIMTSGEVTLSFLRACRRDQPVYLLGTSALWESFRLAGIPLVNGPDGVCRGTEIPKIVVSSFDTELTYAKLAAACDFLRGGAEFLSTHPDVNCPKENGFLPDCGSINALLTASTGREPKYFGKPYTETVDAIEKTTGISREHMCLFGDRLYTDIALGRRSGVTSVLVLSGETDRQMLAQAPEDQRPDYVFSDLEALERELSENL